MRGKAGETKMAAQETFDISRFIDERKMNRFNALVVIFCFFIILMDGYDIGALAYAGPSLVKAWSLTSMKDLGWAFSLGLFGILVGSPLFGYIGDHFGRAKAIVISCLWIGVFTLATMFAGSLDQLKVLRFLTGIGIGGMLPNTITLNAEFAPKRYRATMIIIMFTGITFGGAVPGPVAAWLVPSYGWQVLFLLGGIVPIAVGLAAALWLPESVKYLALHSRSLDVAKTLGQMEPGLSLTADTRFALADEPSDRSLSPRKLFADGLHFITPLLWVLFIVNLMSFYFVNSWLPTVLTTANIPVQDAAWATALFQIGGTLGGLALSRPLDKLGFVPISILFALALLVAPFIGYAKAPEALLMVVVFVAGFAMLGVQFGLNAASAMIYPTAIRSNGSGWAFGIGRFGSATGPLIAGFLIDFHLTIEHLFLVLAIPLAIGTIGSILLARLYQRRFAGMGLGQRDALEAATAARRPGSAPAQ
jgi:AAHS family 4-hydroxybenzoate transporter-like MFS transporter